MKTDQKPASGEKERNIDLTILLVAGATTWRLPLLSKSSPQRTPWLAAGVRTDVSLQ